MTSNANRPVVTSRSPGRGGAIGVELVQRIGRGIRLTPEGRLGLELTVLDRHPVEALQMLRHGEIDVAVVFQYADGANHRDSAWIGGCERCTEELFTVCRREGFTPRIGSLSDDMTVVQALVAAGVGVALLPGLARRAHHRSHRAATAATANGTTVTSKG